MNASQARHLAPIDSSASAGENRSYSHHEHKKRCTSVSAEEWAPFQAPTPVTENASSQSWAHTTIDSTPESSMSGPYDTPCHDYTPTDPLSAGDNLKTFDTQAGKRSSSFLETG